MIKFKSILTCALLTLAFVNPCLAEDFVNKESKNGSEENEMKIICVERGWFGECSKYIKK